MSVLQFNDIFTSRALAGLMPVERSDQFFEALFGDAGEGAYDIGLNFKGGSETGLEFELELRQRPGKCLSCSLTYGLPQVFSRHPVIDVSGLVSGIDELLAGSASCGQWSLGATKQMSAELHVIPLNIELN